MVRCTCGTPKGIVLTLTETAAQPVNNEAEKGENDWLEEGDDAEDDAEEEAEGDATDGEEEGKGSTRGIRFKHSNGI